ncbi:MAG: hypothetical protein CM1200mP28_05890 [Deltaproteobacteria bacterium]|nr:MAG: hypothetical protein CM1200mP28_05890 [Deltaproteobacteria bacterium]
MTDSGGFQIFSLAKLLNLNEEGVIIRSHIDGSKIKLTPEISIAIQQNLGSTIMMCLDECWNCLHRARRENALQA